MALKNCTDNKTPYEQLITEHSTVALRMARRLIRSWGIQLDGDEVRSLANLALCEAAFRYRSEKGASFTTFLYYYLLGHLAKASNSLCEDSRRIQEPETDERSETAAREVQDLDTPLPDEAAIASETYTVLYEALRRLDEIEKRVVLYTCVLGYTVTEAAKELGYSRGHLSRLKHAALRDIESYFGLGLCA